MDQAVRERSRLARDLRDAIGSNQFEVHYQPIASAADQRICGFEALTRWRHPEHGMVPPDKFITLAEQEGLILALGDWVLRAAAQEAASWPDHISISVNLSPMQLTEPDLPGKVREILFETGLAARRLVLEVTETALITDQQAALDALRRLKAMGLRIAMDDFGTGFSSLSTLHSFPFDKIKIDKQFVDGIGRDARSAVIVKAVLGIGRGLGVPVVAEGVETMDQIVFLRAEGCDELQGYFIGRPAPAATFGDVLSPGGARAEGGEPAATSLSVMPAEAAPDAKSRTPTQPAPRKARAAGFR
jgi:EAL domain-containing protein (putative c-di-GMP-specific phosphodiesterase class I)